MSDPRPVPFLYRHADRLVALSAALLALTVYLRTIYPGLFGLGDAAKFAFVGKILGTPHAPGYPLYVMVSHLFSYVPLGTLAYRMNVLSALLAAVAVALLYCAGRVIGYGRPVALATSLALGFGHAFWSKALYAKGYTLNAALVAAGLLFLLTWGETRKLRHLYVAIAIFALSIGNHLIVIALLPALLIYAVWTDWRAALSPRTMLVTAGLVVLGLAQYLLILIRTRQNAPYLEARATNLSELLDVMLARRWAHEIGAYRVGDVIAARLPQLSSLVMTELTMAGLLLAGVGLIVLARRQPRAAALLFLSVIGVVSLTSNMSSNEDQGFLLPAFVALWLLAGAGLQWLFDLLRRTWAGRGAVPAALVATATVLAASALPVSQLVGNYRINDHHQRTFEIRYFNALFSILPDRSAIVDDRYTINMMLNYKLLGEDAAAGRDVQITAPTYDSVSDKVRRGYHVFAFAEGRGQMERLGYSFEPIQLFDLALPDYLDVIGPQWTVALAATPDVAAELRENQAGWGRLGVSRALFEQKVGAPLAVVGVAGGRGRALESLGFPSAEVAVAAGEGIGQTGRNAAVSLAAFADRGQAVISVNGVERARTASGAAVVLVDPSGRVESYALDAARRLRVPFDMNAMPLFRLTGTVSCADVGNAGWTNISKLAGRQLAVRIDNYRPFESKAIFYVAGDAPATPVLTEVSGRGAPQVSVTAFRMAAGSDRDKLRAAALADRFEPAWTEGTAPFVSRLELTINDQGDHRAMRLDLGLAPTDAFVHAAVDLNNPKRATVCGISPSL